MDLFTSQAIDAEKATTAQIEVALAESIAADKVAEREASAQIIQDYIDADTKLSAAGFTAAADDLDEACVVVTFPTDAQLPAFYAAAAKQVVQAYGGTFTSAPYSVRQVASKWAGHLDEIALAL